MPPRHRVESGQTALQVVLSEMTRWEREHGRACNLVRVSPALMADLKLEAVVVPVGWRGRYYLERIPGLTPEWLVDPEKDGHQVSFEPINQAGPLEL